MTQSHVRTVAFMGADILPVVATANPVVQRERLRNMVRRLVASHIDGTVPEWCLLVQYHHGPGLQWAVPINALWEALSHHHAAHRACHVCRGGPVAHACPAAPFLLDMDSGLLRATCHGGTGGTIPPPEVLLVRPFTFDGVHAHLNIRRLQKSTGPFQSRLMSCLRDISPVDLR